MYLDALMIWAAIGNANPGVVVAPVEVGFRGLAKGLD